MTFFALQVAIQVGSLPNLVWWMVMDQWCDLLFGDTVQWPQLFWSTDFKLKYDIFLYFSHWRLQFKLDLNQTWYDEWTLVSDHLYCFVSRSSDHSRSGPLISSWNMTFSYTFRTGDRNSSWILTKLGMIDSCGMEMVTVTWLHGPVITAVLVR